MKYIVDVNGERVAVDVNVNQVEIDGEYFDAGLTSVAGTPIRLVRLGEHLHRIVARRGETRGKWVLDIDGVRVQAEALDERMRVIRDLTAAASGPAGPAPVVAPMPGLVVRVTVAVGDEVSAGQGLVMIEAMKMENELRASAAGVVTAVHAVPGEAVEKGTVLVELGSLAG